MGVPGQQPEITLRYTGELITVAAVTPSPIVRELLAFYIALITLCMS